MAEKLTYAEFVKQAIVKLRTGNYKGIHTVYSGFNEAFRKYFDGANPVEITNQLANEKKIVIRPVKGGVMLTRPSRRGAPRPHPRNSSGGRNSDPGKSRTGCRWTAGR